MTMPEDLSERLKRTAADLDTPLAAFIRETMERRLEELGSARPRKDPLAFMRGRIKDEDPSLSTRVKEALYD